MSLPPDTLLRVILATFAAVLGLLFQVAIRDRWFNHKMHKKTEPKDRSVKDCSYCNCRSCQ